MQESRSQAIGGGNCGDGLCPSPANTPLEKAVNTKTLAEKIGIDQTAIRVRRCKEGGTYFGIKPQVLPNGRLLWPDDAVEQLLGTKPKKGGE